MLPVSKSGFRALLLTGTALTLVAATTVDRALAMTNSTWTDTTGNHAWSANTSDNGQNDNSNWSTGSAPVAVGSGAVFGPLPGTNPILGQNVTISSVIVNPLTPAFSISNPGYVFTITGTNAASINDPILGTIANPNTSAVTNNSSSLLTFAVSNGGTDKFGNPQNTTSLPVNLGSNIALTTGAGGGTFEFDGASSAGGSAITLNAGGSLVITSGFNSDALSNGSGGQATVVSNGGTVDISGLKTGATVGGATTTIESLSGSGSITLGGNFLQLGVAQFDNTEYDGTISGTGGIQLGSNNSYTILTLTGTNTYSGGTTLYNGDAIISNGSALGTGTITDPYSGEIDFTQTLMLANNIVNNDSDFFLYAYSGATVTLTGNISGNGNLEISGDDGSDTLVLSGNNTYTGTTTLDNGTLQIASGSNLGLGPLIVTRDSMLRITSSSTVGQDIELGGTLTADTQANNVTFSGVLSDYDERIVDNLALVRSDIICEDDGCGEGFTGGSLLKVGTGTLTLTNDNTYTGGTTIQQGVISISSPTNLNDSGTNGGLTFTGGTLRTTAPMTLVEGIQIGTGGGTIDTDGNDVTLAGTISDYVAYTAPQIFQSFALVRSDDVVDGEGDGTPNPLTKTGLGTLTITGDNTYTGGTVINQGVVSISDPTNINDSGTFYGLTFGGGTLRTTASMSLEEGITLNSGGGTFDTQGNTVDLDGAIVDGDGPGSLTKTGTGTLFLNNSGNTYSGGTTVNQGTVALGTDNAAGSGPLFVAANATFDHVQYDQTVSSLAGAGVVTSNSGTLTINGSASTIFSGSIQGTGDLVKDGTGMLTLDGVSTFEGVTTVSGGTLEVGDIANPGAVLSTGVTVTSGGTLMGHGTINGSVVSSGTVQPGGTIGTLTVGGNYTQNSAGTFAVEVNPVTASLLKVGGAANIAGTLSILPDAGTYTTGKVYPIITATNGVTGTFGTVNNSSSSVFFVEEYLPNEVDLTTIVPGATPSTPTAAGAVQALVTQSLGQISLTPNQAAVAGSIKSIIPGGDAGLVSALLPIAFGTPAAERAGLDGIAGELRADIATIDLANLTSFQNFLIERMDRRQNQSMTEVNNGLPGTFDVAMNDTDMPLFGMAGDNAVITTDKPSVWIHGYGVLGESGGETGFMDYQYHTGGVVAGADAKVTDDALVGVAVAYEHTDFNLSAVSGDGNYIDTYRISLYGSEKLDPVPLTVDAAFGYAFNDYHDIEGAGVPAISPFQNSRHTGNELSAEGGLSHAFDVKQDLVNGALKITPRVGVEYDNIQQNPYSTTGASVPGLNVNVNGATLNALRSTIGAHADLKLTTSDGTVVTPELRAAYLHDFMATNAPLTENFAAAPSSGFRIAGVHPGREAALVGTGVTVGFSENMSATIGYDAAVRDRELDHTVLVGVKYTW